MYVNGATYLAGRVLKSRWFIGAAGFVAGAIAALLSNAVASAAASVIRWMAWLGGMWAVGE